MYILSQMRSVLFRAEADFFQWRMVVMYFMIIEWLVSADWTRHNNNRPMLLAERVFCAACVIVV